MRHLTFYTAPPQFSGMAAATTSMVRDFGFAMGPALIGAVALGKAGTAFNHALSGSTLPTAIRAAAAGVGPIATNSVPPSVPFSKAAPLAVQALTHGYSIGCAICGIAALVCAVVTVAALGGRREQEAEVALVESAAYGS